MKERINKIFDEILLDVAERLGQQPPISAEELKQVTMAVAIIYDKQKENGKA